MVSVDAMLSFRVVGSPTPPATANLPNLAVEHLVRLSRVRGRPVDSWRWLGDWNCRYQHGHLLPITILTPLSDLIPVVVHHRVHRLDIELCFIELSSPACV